MTRPSITDYIRTLENPVGVFRTLGEIVPERDVYGEVELVAGNSAAIFRYRAGRGMRFLKCYIRPNPYLREIYDYIENFRPALLPEVKLLRNEMYVHTLAGGAGWVDVAEGEWIEGATLDVALAQGPWAENLASSFEKLCRELRLQEWAHGDLKPENIIVCPDGRMRLVDCDAMWIPTLKGQRAVELGTPGFRHPDRTLEDFDKTIDDYPIGVISELLAASSK